MKKIGLKEKKGITLVNLIAYVLAFSIIITVVTLVTTLILNGVQKEEVLKTEVGQADKVNANLNYFFNKPFQELEILKKVDGVKDTALNISKLKYNKNSNVIMEYDYNIEYKYNGTTNKIGKKLRIVNKTEKKNVGKNLAIIEKKLDSSSINTSGITNQTLKTFLEKYNRLNEVYKLNYRYPEMQNSDIQGELIGEDTNLLENTLKFEFGVTKINTSSKKISLKLLEEKRNNRYDYTYIAYNGKFTDSINSIPKVGDTVIYDPTKGVSNTSKLTYTSYKGSPKNGGNGYGTQTITAKANQNEWIIISTANNQIKVMSKELIGDVSGGRNNRFTLKGSTGWLYAEEELHKACSIYGHGKGAKQITTRYQIGNKYTGEAQTKNIIGTGARSMTMEDIVKIMKGESYTDFTKEEKKKINSSYMDPALRTLAYYPTLSSYNDNGSSTDQQYFNNDWYNLANNSAEYDADLVTDPKVKEDKMKLKYHIFKESDYCLSTRCISADSTHTYFFVRRIKENFIGGFDLFEHLDYIRIESRESYLRPVVYLDESMIEEQTQGVWKIK